jgi:hypothetical protein
MSNTAEHIFGEYLTPGGGGYAKQSYDATAGQTTINLSKSVDLVNTAVFRNGHVLDDTDYSFTDEYTLELNVGADLGDDITLLDFGATGVGAFIRFAFTATASQTDFVFDSPINELAHVVFVDGDIIDPADYTINDVLLEFNTGLTVGQTVVVISWRFGQIGADGLPLQTGQAGKILSTDGNNTEWVDVSGSLGLPSQTGNTGKYLQTDGTVISWQDVIHPEELPDQTGNVGYILATNGTTPLWVDPVSQIKIVKNEVINGNFDVWQRGSTGLAGHLTHGPDRWRYYGFGSVYNGSRQEFTLGQTDVPNNPKYFHRLDVAAPGVLTNNYNILGHRIGNVEKFSGKTMTLSFWAKADATKDISLEFFTSYGTGGSASVRADNYSQTARKITLTTSWQQFSITMTNPSASGKTITSDNYLALLFWASGGSAYNVFSDSLGLQQITFDLAQVQFQEGAAVLPFVNQDFETTLEQCQHYYRKSYNIEDAPASITDEGVLTSHVGSPAGFAHSTGTNDSLIDLTDSFDNMQRVPTMVFYSPVTGASGNVYNVDAAADASIASSALTGETSTGYPILAAPANAGEIVRTHYTADAEI